MLGLIEVFFFFNNRQRSTPTETPSSYRPRDRERSSGKSVSRQTTVLPRVEVGVKESKFRVIICHSGNFLWDPFVGTPSKTNNRNYPELVSLLSHFSKIKSGRKIHDGDLRTTISMWDLYSEDCAYLGVCF